MTTGTAPARWQFWIDRGGTFTDVVARTPEGCLLTAKLLSDNPAKYQDAAIAAMRQLTGHHTGPLPLADVRMGTTVATNALLERTGEPTLLAITRGFADALRIGYQERPHLFVRRIDLPEPLYARVVEIDERVTAAGDIHLALDCKTARAALQLAFDDGLRAIAIILMHGYKYTAHEQALAEIAAEIGFTQISVSHRVGPLIKLVGRGDTTVVDAYLSPVLRHYVTGFTSALECDARPLFMRSNGGLTDGSAFHGKDAILSGPAGGIVGMAETARQAGFHRVIGFDMGGTSTDVSHFAGHYDRDSETQIAGVRIRASMMRIHTVAAGGGSVCRFDGTKFQVGPQSAGAIPGPASYRGGGPLTVTDCNIILGKIQPDYFPKLFGPTGDEPLDPDAVRRALADMTDSVVAATGKPLSAEATAEGCIAIAVANMANAIKRISVARGHDVTRYTLACFGGAAGQHACLVADALTMNRVMIHPLAGVLSAYGMGLADQRTLREKTLTLCLTPELLPVISDEIAALCADAKSALVEQGVDGNHITFNSLVFLRHDGTDNAIDVAFDDIITMQLSFNKLHQAQFGFVGSTDLIVDRVRVEAIFRTARDTGSIARLPEQSSPPVALVDMYLAGAWHKTPLHDRAGLAAGFSSDGPLLIIDPVSTTVVEPGWRVSVDPEANLILTRQQARADGIDIGTDVDPVRLEIFNGMFMAIAEEMGAALQRSASSVNIRERLDFSCAVFDAAGNLVANAPHMPVHLGSMGDSIRTILTRRGDRRDGRGLLPGDAYALNAPYDGGTHLPDITVVMPVFLTAKDAAPAYFVAARGHHADIGGISPGSMPPDSLSVEEEGVLLDNVLIVDQGTFLDDDIDALLRRGPWPSRNPAQNIADLRAQVAACAKGASELQHLSATYGETVVRCYMEHVQANAEDMVRQLISRLSDGRFSYEMDNGAVVKVAVHVDPATRSATVDFTGTSSQLPGNFNAPVSVVRAAVLYVVRTLIDDSIPMNDGCLRPIRIVVPEGSMLSPRFPAAVVAGNVETSQVITDALFGALGVMAGAQGTMNNFTFGNERHQYYETIAGGSGAGPDFDGASVVQTHMTNSRLTDPEILESRFPVLLEAFSIRRGSGGNGAHKGGDGAVRRIRFLEPMDAGILSNRRIIPPFGLEDGDAGAPGRNQLERADGSIERLAATASVRVAPGDVFVIETPGGGGFGKAS